MACAKPGFQASYRWIHENQRLHVQHGPIDLIILADGVEQERILAFQQAVHFFDSVLEALVAELALLRSPVGYLCNVEFNSIVAQQMHKAVAPYVEHFITPMAAVAGSVAQCTLAAMCHSRDLERVAINNGGDIALHLQAQATFSVGVCENPVTGEHGAKAIIETASPVRGIATSGWQGRSHSLGIADAVTVLANDAAQADVAATLIANHVDLPGSNKVDRVAASSLSPDSDLGDRLVTVGVKTLSPNERCHALDKGVCFSQSLVERGLINSAVLSVQGHRKIVGKQHPILQQSINGRQSA